MSDIGRVRLGLRIDEDGIGKQIGVIAKQTSVRFTRAFRASMQNVMKGFQASAKKMPAPDVDTSKVQAEIDHLSDVLDNTNAKLDAQRQKLNQLKESYQNTFNEARKNRLQEQILNTEASIIRLTRQSDTTSQKIWQLEDSLNAVGKTARKSGEESEKGFKRAASAAGSAGTAFKTAGKRVSDMGNQFTQAFNRIAKQVLIFAVIYRSIRTFQDYTSSALNTNEEFRRSLDQIRQNLKTAFQPIFNAVLPAINALMNALVRITAYIAAFTSSLFGTTAKQSQAAAKELDKAREAVDGYGSAAKKATGQLAGFDEVNQLVEDTSGGAGALEMESPDFDFADVQSRVDELVEGVKQAFEQTWQNVKNGWDWLTATFAPGLVKAWKIMRPELERWKGQFSQIFEDIRGLGEPLKNWVSNDVVPVWDKGVTGIATVLTRLSTIVREAFGAAWSAAYPNIQKFISEGLPRFTDFVTRVQGTLGNLFDIVLNVFESLWRDAAKPAVDMLGSIISDALDIIFQWWDAWGTSIFDSLNDTLEELKGLFITFWDGYLKPFIGAALSLAYRLWDEHLSDLIIEVGNFIGALVKAALDILNNFILPVAKWLLKTLAPAFKSAFSLIGNVLGIALGVVIDVATGIIKFFRGVADFFLGVFTGDWEKAWDGIKTIIEAVSDAIMSIFEAVKDFIVTTWEFVRDTSKEIWEGIKDFLSRLWENIKSAAENTWNDIKSSLSFVWDWLKARASSDFNAIKNTLSSILFAIKDTFSTAWGDIRNSLSASWEWIQKTSSQTFGNISDNIANAFESMKNRVVRIWDALTDNIKGAVNVLIGMVNNVIDGFNNIKIKVPKISLPFGGSVGGYEIGLPRIPRIPALAQGGLVEAPTLAMVGDNRGASVDPEVVSPLSKLQAMLGASNEGIIEVLLMILQAIEQQNENRDSEATIELDGTQLGRLIKPYIDSENQRIGARLVTTS